MTMLLRPARTLVAAIALAGVSLPASATLIDFNSADADFGLADDDEVTNQYQSTAGVTFVGGFLEAFDEDEDDGFVNDQIGINDRETGSPTPGLGEFFLRTGTSIDDGGPTVNNPLLQIEYDTPVSAASGEIWDIDGTSETNTEQWELEVFLSGSSVGTLTSPEGTSNGAGSLDGLPWAFSIAGFGDFDRIDFNFIGSKTSGIGLAFDNFNADSASIPGPASLALLGLGLAGFGAVRRIRQ